MRLSNAFCFIRVCIASYLLRTDAISFRDSMMLNSIETSHSSPHLPFLPFPCLCVCFQLLFRYFLSLTCACHFCLVLRRISSHPQLTFASSLLLYATRTHHSLILMATHSSFDFMSSIAFAYSPCPFPLLLPFAFHSLHFLLTVICSARIVVSSTKNFRGPKPNCRTQRAPEPN